MKNSKKLVVANWKMAPDTAEEARQILSGIKRKITVLKKTKVVICPPFVFLEQIRKNAPSGINVGVQNIFHESKGAYTGEISVGMAQGLGATYVILGHSERRALGESDWVVNEKILAALRSGLVVIACIGEKLRDSDGEFLKHLKEQIQKTFARLPRKFLENLIIAYEPIWAIGRGDREAMKSRDIHETTIFIKKVLSEMYGQEEVSKIPILYGGSVGPQNTEDIIKNGEVDGLLVGHQSLLPEKFNEILLIVEKS